MTLETLQDVYIDQLQDLYSANRQALDITRKLETAATDPALKKALADGVAGIERGRDSMAELVRGHGADPTEEHCRGMEGLVREANAHAVEASFGAAEARDAAIVAQYQRLTHYAMAGYGCSIAFARRLGHEADAEKLVLCLDGTRTGDREMQSFAAGDLGKAA